MNKKAVTGSVIVILILLVFLYIIISIFFFPNALLPKIAEWTKGLERFLPGRAEKEIPPGLDAPKEVIDIFDSLYNAIKSSQGKLGCFQKYKSLDIGDYTIELGYIEAEKGLYMRLIDKNLRQVSSHFISGVKPCIVLPDKNGNIAKVSPLQNAEIKDNNELYFGGKSYDMFGKYPVVYKPKKELYPQPYKPDENDWACFFTDDYVIDPISGNVYGNNWYGLDGFEDGDIIRLKTGIEECNTI